MFGLWRKRPAEPSVILLRGPGRPKEPDQVPLHEVLLPRAFSLEVGEAHRERLRPPPDLVVRRAWLDRGFELPPFACAESLQLKAQEVSLSLYGVEQRRLVLSNSATVEGLLPGELLQLEIARMLAESSRRLLTRDAVRNLALAQGVELEAPLLSRLSKYFRGCWQAGWSLPPPSEWAELAASAPFDEIGSGPQPALERRPLPLGVRKELLFSLIPSECRAQFGPIRLSSPADVAPSPVPIGPDHLQAVEEFCQVARLSARGPLREAVPLLRACLLEDRVGRFQERCRQQPREMLKLLAATERLAAPTLPPFQKLAIHLQVLDVRSVRRWLEDWLGPLPPLRCNSEQLERVLNDPTL